jgi:hypothetical protein
MTPKEQTFESNFRTFGPGSPGARGGTLEMRLKYYSETEVNGQNLIAIDGQVLAAHGKDGQ